MRFYVVLRYAGMVLLYVAAFMLAAAGVSLLYGWDSSFSPLLLSALLTALLGVFPMLFVPKTDQINSKEGFCIVVGAWILSCIVGMFPYLIWGGEFSFVNAWFESVSGFTTTGASILTNIEGLPAGLLFWRTSTGWIGGIGVVMFALVIVPSLGKTKMMLSNVELSSLAKDSYRYRTQQIVRILLSVYIIMTIISVLSLKLAGMRWFDAVNHGMSACATCGFSTKNTSVAAFDSPLVNLVMAVSMWMSGLHFGVIFATVTGKHNNIFRSGVTRLYFLITFVTAILVAANLYIGGIYDSIASSLMHGSFQVVSLITTGGFATADTNQWPAFSIMMLIFVSLICACAGSTSGGIKIDRLLICAKMVKARLRGQQHPTMVSRLKVDGVVQSPELLGTVTLFVVVYFVLIFIGAVVNTMFGMDLLSGVTASIACIGNVGPAFGTVGSLESYSALPAILKLQDTLLMLLGRLEIFGFIQLLFIKWWR
ncbi:MAG: TrkH family potassium uptake protein [Alistipes sp.]|nr:TrkH family potassium uptake protein [Alistipes sp.]